ncbi:MAG TPA: hypothetical protein ENK20_10500 [Chromatiales bacterium]|nr:hypothetical protein [Chromatiales bacterium]
MSAGPACFDDPARLRALVGLELDWEGHRWQVIEVLPDGPTVVLQATDGAREIQANQHGEAVRRVPRCREVPARDADGGPHPELLGLLAAAGLLGSGEPR